VDSVVGLFNHLFDLFTQERDVTIVDPLGSLNNIMKLTRQTRTSPHQNISSGTQNISSVTLPTALTVGRVTQYQVH
jgi:hypothetical protein